MIIAGSEGNSLVIELLIELADGLERCDLLGGDDGGDEVVDFCDESGVMLNCLTLATVMRKT